MSRVRRQTMDKKNTLTISVSLPASLVEKIEELMEGGYCTNRSEWVRQLIIREIEKTTNKEE